MDIGKDLTKRQQEIFDFIKKYSAKYGYPPTVRDIGKAIGLTGNQGPIDPGAFQGLDGVRECIPVSRP
jgi:sulfur relay (sulfurtransferase) DsrC/TusE family protein